MRDIIRQSVILRHLYAKLRQTDRKSGGERERGKRVLLLNSVVCIFPCSAIIAKSKYKFWMNINSDVITAAKLTSVAMTSSTAAKSTSVVMTSTTAAKLTSVVMSSSTAANVASEVSNSSTVSSVVSDVTTPYTTSGNLDNTSDPVQPASNTTGNNDDTNGANAPGKCLTVRINH